MRKDKGYILIFKKESNLPPFVDVNIIKDEQDLERKNPIVKENN